MDKIILIHGGETVARIECNTAYTNELFLNAAEVVVDYVIATTADDGILWVADGMTEQVWEPESTNPEDTRKETLDRFPELAGKW
jgi:hypothetical protein